MESFLGNKEAKKQIKDFLMSDLPQTLIVIAPNGSGKTTFCNLALAMFKEKYRIFVPNIENIETHKHFTEQINDFINIPPLLSKQNLLPCLFIDDIEILFSHDRYACSFLLSLVNKTKMLLTCSTGEEKKTTELKKKNVNILRLQVPDIKEIIAVYGEHMYKQALLSECNVGLMLKGNVLNMKYFDKNIYDIVNNLFLENDGTDGLQEALINDPSLISFMMYDNYQKQLFKKKVKQTLPLFLNISKAFLDTSIIEDAIFKTNDHHSTEALNMIRCQTIRNQLSNLSIQPISSEIQYTQINSRSAQHYNMTKKLCDQNVFFDDIAMEAEQFYINKKKTPKSDYGSVINAYILNYCKSV